MNPEIKNLLDACKEFTDGWNYFCSRINWNESFLDAKAIRFMNEVLGKIEQAAKKVKETK